MTTEELVNSIRRLHELLEKNEPLETTAKEALLAITEEIRQALASADRTKQEATEAEPTLASQVSDWIIELEAKHPQLTHTLSQIADRLSDMGI